jgi:dephospho-CoA kinase
MYNPIRIGVTGGIGSGKTTVSRLFGILNVPVYNADLRAKYLINNSPIIASQIIGQFGEQVYSNNILNGKLLAQIVFNNPNELEKLNNIVHPHVFQDFDSWTQLHKNQHYIIKEAALIYETILHQKLDKIIVVTAPLDLRIARTIKRDKIRQQDVTQRMANQMSDSEKIKKADWVINNGNYDLLMPQVLHIHQQLLLLH